MEISFPKSNHNQCCKCMLLAKTRTNKAEIALEMLAGVTGATFPFSLKPIDVDSWGHTSCGVEWTGPETKSERPQKPVWSGNARVFKTAMVHAMIEHGERKRPFGFEAPEVKAVAYERVRIEFYARYPGDAGTKRKAFNRLVTDCTTRDLISSREIDGTDWLWFLDDSAAMEAQPSVAAE